MNGVTRQGMFGSFTEIADGMKEGRADEPEPESESVKTGSGVQESGEQPDSNDETCTLEAEDTRLSTTEREFVKAYFDAGAPPEHEVIEPNIEENINEVGGIARTDVLVEVIQARTGGG